MHVYPRRRTHSLKKPVKRKESKFFEFFIYCIAIIAPLMTLPQVWEVWGRKNVNGVSLSTWAAYTVVACFWLLYGIKKKETPIILANILIGILDLGIVVGVLLLK